MTISGFYIIKDEFFHDMNDPYLKGNKLESRPHYYCFRDISHEIYSYPARRFVYAKKVKVIQYFIVYISLLFICKRWAGYPSADDIPPISFSSLSDDFYSSFFFTPRVTFSPLIFHSFVKPAASPDTIPVASTSFMTVLSFFEISSLTFSFAS